MKWKKKKQKRLMEHKDPRIFNQTVWATKKIKWTNYQKLYSLDEELFKLAFKSLSKDQRKCKERVRGENKMRGK